MKPIIWNLSLIIVLFVVLSDCANKTRIKGKANDVNTHLLSPAINAYGGRTGQRAVFKCRANLMVDGTIKWYKKASRSSCSVQDTVIDNGDVYCLLNRSKLTVRKNIMVSKLVFKNPRPRNSGIYMCIASSKFNNITQKMKMNFHDAKAPPVRIIDSPDGILADGTVEIFYNKSWNRVRFYTLTNEEAHIICKTLGYNFGSEPRFLRLDRPWPYRTKTNKNTKFLSMKCPENAQALLNECRFWYENMNDIAAGKTTCTERPNKDDRYHFKNYHGDLLRPIVTAYRGNVGEKAILRCRFRLYKMQFSEVNWYKKSWNNSSCVNFHTTITTSEGTFCLERRTRVHRRKKKVISKLIIEKPTPEDSGLYLCVLSIASDTIKHSMRLSFDEELMPPIRLADSTSRNVGEGRVEIFYKNHWNKVHIFTWETPEASLICRLLGYRYGGEPRFQIFDGESFLRDHFRGRKFINTPFIRLNCPLNGTRLQDCKGWNVTHKDGHAVGATCRRTPVKIPDKPIRFASTSPTEGRVEVFSNGYWGTVCIRGLTENEISTICRTLGHSYGGIKYRAWDRYSAAIPGVGPIMVTGLKCPLNATDLNQCSHNGYGQICCGCTHNDDLAVRCHERPKQNENTQIRLSGFGRDDKGRVELLINGSWVMIRPYWLQYPEANVLCKMLGYRYGGKPLHEQVPSARGLVLISYIECPLFANTLENCSIQYNKRSILSSQAVGGGVICRKEPLKVPDVPFKMATNKEGTERLQYYKDGYWGTVCGAYIGTPEASMICSMMGFNYGGKLIKHGKDWSFYGLGPILLKYLDCPVDATDITQCPFRNYTTYNNRLACYSYSDHRKDISISCNKRPVQLPDVRVRLNGTNSNNGLLNVYHNNGWRFVSYYDEPVVASVVCRQLGYRSGGEMYKSFVCFGHECNVSVSLKGYAIDCTGKEQNLGHCNKLEWPTYWSWEDRPTGIHCYQNEKPYKIKPTLNDSLEGDVILTKAEGDRVEEYAICAKLWDDIHAHAYCRTLGYSDGVARYNRAKQYVRNSGNKMILKMYCQRGTESLYDCFHSGWNGYEEDCFNGLPTRAAVRCTA